MGSAQIRRVAHLSPLVVLAALTAACATLPSSGPSIRAVADVGAQKHPGEPPVQLVDITGNVSRRLVSLIVQQSFATLLDEPAAYGSVVGPGDLIGISVWEAPPALLFGSSISSQGGGNAAMTSHNSTLPEQLVNQDGLIRVPFIGSVQAGGRTPEAIGSEIQRRLAGKAHNPQVIVRIVRNEAATVTVVGEVTNATRMPLSARGERLLDALASAGGVRQSIDKITVQITREDHVVAMPLVDVIRDPRENVRLAARDVVTALYQPYSFTVLGAANKNEEIPFERTGLSLAQALGRMGGLNDQRASAKGLFIFRFEAPEVFTAVGQPSPATAANGKVPVIYRADLKDPLTLFAAQAFPIKDKDVVFVSNAPSTDFQKFLQILTQIAYPIISVESALNRF
jgi:polysaccharide export outer membrane protein